MRRIWLWMMLGASVLHGGFAYAQSPAVLKDQFDRVAVCAKVKPAVVAVFAKGGQGGGTGVLISDDGYALTNFHVVQPTGPTMLCGLADGVLYDAVLVGLDKVGDVALIKLLPKTPGAKFPFVKMGDSETLHEGDWSIAMGNPFLLATDFTPTVTYGLVSGVHRYQPPSGLFLEYTDCIQFDTSINPGNSGGPLFNTKGELVGINGRGSFDKRGRVNSGVGYAISINQIKNFLGHLKAGIDTDHASLGAIVQTSTEASGVGKMVVTTILDDCDAAKRGLDQEDQLLSFAGRQISSVNHFKNVMGIYPRGWRLPLEFARENKGRKEVLVRLMGIQRKEVPDAKQPPAPGKQPQPGKQGPPAAFGPGAKLYEAKPGFANYHFNRVEKDRLFASFQKHGDFSKQSGAWSFDGDVAFLKAQTGSPFKFESVDEKVGASFQPKVIYTIKSTPYTLLPVATDTTKSQLSAPTGSGGVMSAMYVLRHLLTTGPKGFATCHHAGVEPFYPPTTDPKATGGFAKQRVDCEALDTRFGPFLTRFLFSQQDQKLVGFEMRLAAEDDPCEVYLSDWRAVDGRQLPHRIRVLHSDLTYGTFTIANWKLAAGS